MFNPNNFNFKIQIAWTVPKYIQFFKEINLSRISFLVRHFCVVIEIAHIINYNTNAHCYINSNVAIVMHTLLQS
jgi:hypothetical protein